MGFGTVWVRKHIAVGLGTDCIQPVRAVTVTGCRTFSHMTCCLRLWSLTYAEQSCFLLFDMSVKLGDVLRVSVDGVMRKVY